MDISGLKSMNSLGIGTDNSMRLLYSFKPTRTQPVLRDIKIHDIVFYYDQLWHGWLGSKQPRDSDAGVYQYRCCA